MAKGQDVTVTTFRKLSDYLGARFVTKPRFFASKANSYDALVPVSCLIIARVVMSLFKPALAAYFEKCGVGAADAKRVQGELVKTTPPWCSRWKSWAPEATAALAAVQIADDAFFTPSHYPDGPHWAISNRKRYLSANRYHPCRRNFSIAIYNHAFGQDVVIMQQQAQRPLHANRHCTLACPFPAGRSATQSTTRTSKGLTALFS